MEHVLKNYKTMPLECWGKAKESRYNFFTDFSTALEQSKYNGLDGAVWLNSHPGTWHAIHPVGEIYVATIGSSPASSHICDAAVEAIEGFFPRPEFVISKHTCDSRATLFQTVELTKGRAVWLAVPEE